VESMVDRDLRMVPDGNLDTATALIYDSVHAFALALHELSAVQQEKCWVLSYETKKRTFVVFAKMINYGQYTKDATSLPP
jgi:hypothetical protein